MKILGLKIGSKCYEYCAEADARRVNFSERSLSFEAREARMSLKSARKEEEESYIDTEGQLYGAGIAD